MEGGNRGTCSNDSAVGAIGDKLGIGWRRVQAAVTRSTAIIVDRQLTFPAEGTARDQRPAGEHAGVVDQIARRRIVGAIQHDVVARNDFHRVAAIQLDVVSGHPDEGIQRADGLGQRRGLGGANARLAVHNLPVEIAQLNDVVVDHAQMSYSGSR